MTDLRRSFAYHEAGHGVVTTVLGGIVHAITLHAHGAETDSEILGADRRLHVALAGLAAENEFIGSADPRASRGDFLKAYTAAMALARDEDIALHEAAAGSSRPTRSTLTLADMPLIEAAMAAKIKRQVARAHELVAAAGVEARRLVVSNGIAISHAAEALERFGSLREGEVREIVAEGLRRQSVADHGWISQAFRSARGAR